MTDVDDLAARMDAIASAGLSGLGAADGQADSAGGGDEPFLPYYGSLEEWVVSMFAPTFCRRSTPAFRWCPQWWRHAEAISRLEALWRSWEQLRLDPLMGMASWYRDHLDHQLPILTAADGPFAGCDSTRHFHPERDRLPHDPPPADWWPPANT